MANVAADAWLLPTKTNGVADGDLVASGDNKSATFTGHIGGDGDHTGNIGDADYQRDSGLLTVTTNGCIILRLLQSVPRPR